MPVRVEANGPYLKQVRHQRGLSQSQLVCQLRQLASDLGKSADLPYTDASMLGMISYYENGHRPVPKRWIPLLREILHLSETATVVTSGMVATWHQYPDTAPGLEVQQLLDLALSHASPAAQTRFALLLARNDNGQSFPIPGQDHLATNTAVTPMHLVGVA
jgi:transcriptional regulator with XRE-family HTH domain